MSSETAGISLPPMDAHNRELVENVHPPDWRNPTPDGVYNLVVIGAGTAGLVTASAAAQMGARVALIEKHLLGGDCLNVGCVPSKGLLSAARAAAAVRNAANFGVTVDGDVRVDFPAAMERIRRLRAGISHHDSAARFRDLGVDVYLGEGRFTDGATVEVDGQRLSFRRAVIATGARAAAPPIPGLAEVDYLTNETVFSLTELPDRFGIIGAGPIGCEMAQAFARFGSHVILVEASDQILPREDGDAAAIVRESLRRDGVTILCGGKDAEVQQSGEVRLQVACNGVRHDEPVDRLLVAVGRAPNVENLNLEAAGVEYDRQGVTVDDRLRTTNPDIFAAGDVCSAYKFTHAADFMARIVLRNALFLGRSRVSALTIPWCTYTSPELAHVGLYEHEAAEQRIRIDTFEQPLDGVDRAVLDGQQQGFVRIHVRKGSDRIVGATIVAAHAGDMIAHVTFAMTSGLGLKQIADTIHPYPTQSEAIRKVGDLYNRTRLTPPVRSLMQKWLAWKR
ncbi:MAG: mercuric reductase [Planctomycetota bacterium]|nr:MAG: mercuric reductase [Planctomycetota bacterium]